MESSDPSSSPHAPNRRSGALPRRCSGRAASPCVPRTPSRNPAQWLHVGRPSPPSAAPLPRMRCTVSPPSVRPRPCHLAAPVVTWCNRSHRITTSVTPTLSPGASRRHIGSQPPARHTPAARPRMTPSQPDRAPWGSRPRPRPHQIASSLFSTSSAMRSACCLSRNRLRCLPPVPTPCAMRTPCSRNFASSFRNARTVAMLRAA